MAEFIDNARGSVALENPALVFFDIDGTLLDRDGHYSQETVAEIKRIQSLGVKTAVASGRPHFAARFLTHGELQLKDAGVFFTGALIYDPGEDHIIDEHVINEDDCIALCTALREADIYYELYTRESFYIERDSDKEIQNIHAEHLRCKAVHRNFTDIIGHQDVVKFLIGADMLKDKVVLEKLEKSFPNCIFAYAGLPAYPTWKFASIIPKSASKDLAFARMLEYHGVSREQVISFGDAQSDSVFLRNAGAGIAMGNAPQEVQNQARWVTRPVWENGVAYALSKLIV